MVYCLLNRSVKQTLPSFSFQNSCSVPVSLSSLPTYFVLFFLPICVGALIFKPNRGIPFLKKTKNTRLLNSLVLRQGAQFSTLPYKRRVTLWSFGQDAQSQSTTKRWEKFIWHTITTYQPPPSDCLMAISWRTANDSRLVGKLLVKIVSGSAIQGDGFEVLLLFSRLTGSLRNLKLPFEVWIFALQIKLHTLRTPHTQ